MLLLVVVLQVLVASITSGTTVDGRNPAWDVIKPCKSWDDFYLSTGAGFLPSIVVPVDSSSGSGSGRSDVIPRPASPISIWQKI